MTAMEMRARQLSEFTIGTLGALTAQLSATRVDSTRLNGCRIDKIRYNVDWFGKTAGANEGPILFGYSRGMTTAEIAACFAADPQSRQDTVQLDASQSPMLVLGSVGQSTTESGNSNASGGQRMHSARFPWKEVIEGDNFHHFVFNLNPANAMATGMILSLYSELYGDWLRD